jgi:hypothetical protein
MSGKLTASGNVTIQGGLGTQLWVTNPYARIKVKSTGAGNNAGLHFEANNTTGIQFGGIYLSPSDTKAFVGIAPDDANYSARFFANRETQLEMAADATATTNHLELYAPDDTSTKFISMRFHMGNQYYGAIRYNNAGFHFTAGGDTTTGAPIAKVGTIASYADGTHITLRETDGPDAADRGIMEVGGGNFNLYTHDNSTNTWRLPFSANIATGLTNVGSGGQLVLIGTQSGAADLNSYYIDGYARITFGQVTTGVTNAPEAPDNANMIISYESHAGGYGRQMYYPDTANVWTRLHSAGSWGEWRKFATVNTSGFFTEPVQYYVGTGSNVVGLSLRNEGASALMNTSIFMGYGGSASGYGWRITSNNNPSSSYAGRLEFWRGNGSYALAGYFDNSSNLYVSSSVVIGTGYAYYMDGGSSITIRYNGSGTYGPIRIEGNKSSYGGIYDSYSGVNFGMFDGSGNGGNYREANGSWHFYWHQSNGCLGVKGSTTSASYAMYVSGGIYATGDIVAYSDERKKKNVAPITDALNLVTQLRGVWYERTDDDTGTRKTGVIAQEVEKVLPEVVTHSETLDAKGHTADEYGVDYGKFAGVFIEAIKELRAEVKERDAMLIHMKERIIHLEKKLGII